MTHPERQVYLPSAMFLGGLTIANIGAFVSFLPLLQILLPLKAQELAPHAAAALLGTVAAVGAVVAGLANLAVGWLSDRTRPRLGRRAWIIAGAVGVALSYALIVGAQSGRALIAAFAVFQLAFNMLFAPLLALIPDRIVTARRGVASALVALGNPVGTVIGVVIIGAVLARTTDRYWALATIVLVSIVPFAVRLGADPPPARPTAIPDGFERRLTRDFATGWLSRACVISAFAIAQIYLLFLVAATVPPGRPHAAEHAVALLAVVFGVVSAIAGLVMGRASDRLGRRKPFIIGGALAVGAGMLALAVAPSWPLMIAAYALFAAGAGCYTAVEFAMMIDLLPSRDRPARDLGLLNLSNIVPQVIAPLGATLLLSLPGGTIHSAFATAGLAAVAGAALIGVIRSVR